MVPTPKKEPRIQLVQFNNAIAYTFALLVLLLLSLFSFINKINKIDFSFYCITLWAIFWLNPACNLNKFKGKFKALLLLLIFAFMIMGNYFGPALISVLVSVRAKKPISTLEELRKSNLSIYIADYYIENKYISDSLGLNDKFIPVLQPEYILKLINVTELYYGFVVRKDAATFFSNELRYSNGLPIYTVVDESLLPGVNVYSLQKNSPYCRGFNTWLLRIQQYGFSIYKKRQNKSTSKSDEILALSLKHFCVTFLMLILGYGIAGVAFLMELVWYRYGNLFLEYKLNLFRTILKLS